MPYRADFYIPQNIIGYTGTISDEPTVYFQSGTAYGHITQKHDIRQNVGREGVKQAQDYRIFNNSNGVAEEWANARRFHTSRNAFMSANGLGSVSLTILSLAIAKHKEMKQWSDMDRTERTKVLQGKIL